MQRAAYLPIVAAGLVLLFIQDPMRGQGSFEADCRACHAA